MKVRDLNRLRKRVLSRVLDLLKDQRARVSDDYPIKMTDVYIELLRRGSPPSEVNWHRKASRIKTRFYRENHHIRKARLLNDIGKSLQSTLRGTTELQELLASRKRFFVSHSNLFPMVYQHFASVMRGAGYEAVIAEGSPNLGKSWNPGQKVKRLMKRCRGLVAVLTPDDPQTKLPRLNVIHEIGLAQGFPIPIIYLKAKETDLPSNTRPVYISFRLSHPEDADAELLSNLKSLE